MDVGSELRDARERRRLSIEDLSHRTKITPAILIAVDENDLAHLPGGIFTRAFVKQYAREVGLDPIDMVQRYEAQFVPEPASAAGPPENPRIDLDGVTYDDIESQGLKVGDVRLLAIAAAVMLAVISYVVYSRSHAETARVEPRAAAVADTAPDATSTSGRVTGLRPVGTAGSVNTAPARSTSTGELQVELRPRNTCWIGATADGSRVSFRLLNAGERVTLNATRELVLRVGDAGSLDFSVNGSRGRSLGKSAEAVTITLTPANYREFLAR